MHDISQKINESLVVCLNLDIQMVLFMTQSLNLNLGKNMYNNANFRQFHTSHLNLGKYYVSVTHPVSLKFM